MRFKKQKVVKKNLIIKESLVLNVINNTLVNVIIKDTIYNVSKKNALLLKVFNKFL